MSDREHPESVGFSSEWARDRFPSPGPNWDAAIDYGFHVSLLIETLALTPAERLRRLQQLVAFHELLKGARVVGR